MSAPFFIPFNNKPASVGSGTSYTVPAGKYARVTYNMAVNARGVLTLGVPEIVTNISSSDSLNGVIWLNPGDAITAIKTAATGTTSIIGTPAYSTLLYSTSTATVRVNGTDIAQIFAPTSIQFNGTGTTQLEGESVVNFHWEEFNVIS
jgi:hypothetical protein